MKFIDILLESLNSKGGKTYPEVDLIPFDKQEKRLLGDGFSIQDQKTSNKVGAVVLKSVDGVDNVVYSIFIEPEFRGKSYAVPTYVKIAETLGSVCSGEFREDGTPTSFVSKEANDVWKRLNDIFDVEKLPIQGNKFRYCLKKENI